nr:MAG TPA: hypothetical protein [Caudoviricetes sp.]
MLDVSIYKNKLLKINNLFFLVGVAGEGSPLTQH